MSSLNITTKMKATLLHVVAVARSQALMLLDAPLLKLWRSRPLAYREGKHRKLRMAHCYMSLLREFHYEGQYIFDILIFVLFICLENRTYLDNDFRKKGVSEHLHPRLQRCINTPANQAHPSRCTSSHSLPSNIICIIYTPFHYDYALCTLCVFLMGHRKLLLKQSV